MELSELEIREKVETLTMKLITLSAKEALDRALWDIERKELLSELDRINEVVGVKDTFGNGMAAIELKKRFGWVLVKTNLERGTYYGYVVALERHLALVKFTNTDLVELPFGSMAATEEESPKLGDTVRMDYKNGVLTTHFLERKRN